MKIKLRNQKGFTPLETKMAHGKSEGLSKSVTGFTIIEVLIVLAIAGLIMLIVFLAVPALQRNSRNTQRTSDASRMAAAVSECLNNNNGLIVNCDDFTDTTKKLKDYITIGNNQQLTATSSAPAGGGAAAGTLNSVVFAFNTKCDDAGSASVGGGGSRSFTLVYLVEAKGTATAGRCIGS